MFQYSLLFQLNTTDCRGELASLNDEGKYPIFNSIGLPLYNPVSPLDGKIKSATRFYRKCSYQFA